MTDVIQQLSVSSHSKERRRFKPRLWICAGVLVAIVITGLWLWRHLNSNLDDIVDRGWQAYQAEDVDSVQRQMALAARIDKESGAARLLRGAFLLMTGEPELALVPLRDASREPKLRHRGLLLAARAYLNLHQVSAAEQLLTACQTEEPNEIEMHRLFAAMYYDLGVNPMAIEHLEAVARLAPTDARPLRMIGMMRKDFQDYTAAVAAYREALTRVVEGPLAAELRLELAQSLAELRQYEDALAALNQADQSPEAIAVRLLSTRALGRTEAARELALRASQIRNPPLSLILELGTFWDSVGDLRKASSAFELAVKKAPLDFIPRYKLSSIYARQGKKSEAAEQMEQMQINRQRYDRLHTLQNLAMHEPKNAAVRYDLGVASLAIGRPDLARVWFTGAISLDPDHQPTRLALKSLPKHP